MRNRRGYALLWFIVIVSVFAAIAAAATPYLTMAEDRRAVDSTARILRDLGVAINNMEAGVSRKFPGRPSQVTNYLTSAGNYRIMSCWNNTYSGGDSTTWTTVAPFAAFYVPTNGLWTPLGRIRDSVENRAGNQNTAFIWLDIPGANAELVRMLDVTVDGVLDSLNDTIQYNPPVNETTTVRYRVTPRELGRC
jgi:hypothetical protein